eukprot:scaffold372840_cov27-Prasinocladus_malaysianus.AAC.1
MPAFSPSTQVKDLGIGNPTPVDSNDSDDEYDNSKEVITTTITIKILVGIIIMLCMNTND